MDCSVPMGWQLPSHVVCVVQDLEEKVLKSRLSVTCSVHSTQIHTISARLPGSADFGTLDYPLPNCLLKPGDAGCLALPRPTPKFATTHCKPVPLQVPQRKGLQLSGALWFVQLHAVSARGPCQRSWGRGLRFPLREPPLHVYYITDGTFPVTTKSLCLSSTSRMPVTPPQPRLCDP